MERLSILYATALFDLALQKDKVDEFLEHAVKVHDSLCDPEFARLLIHPHIPASEKHTVFNKLFAGSVHEDILGLLYLAADKNREAFLPQAFEEFIIMTKRHKKIVTARVSSASPFDENQAGNLKRILCEKLHKTVELDISVNSSLIGGPYIFVDGYYIDWTVKKRLRDLTVHMKAGCSS